LSRAGAARFSVDDFLLLPFRMTRASAAPEQANGAISRRPGIDAFSAL